MGAVAVPVFDTPEPISVTLDLAVADVRIIASDRSETVVDVRPSNQSRTADLKAADQTRVEYANDRLSVRMAKDWTRYTPFGGTASVDITIELPTGSQVHGVSEMGPYDVDGRLEDCTIRTGAGSVRLDRTGPLTVNTGMGEVVASRVAGGADIATGSGQVRVGVVDGPAVVKNGNGETRIGEVGGDLRVKAANGDIIVAKAQKSVVAKSANGNVRIGDVVNGAVVMETAAGEIEVGIHEGTAAYLDVKTHYGNVRSSLRASTGSEPSGATVEVRARTSYGDIVISRAPA
jgi:DUF4097 and DUF4098 domain-containing protein YvlB